MKQLIMNFAIELKTLSSTSSGHSRNKPVYGNNKFECP